MAPPGPSIAGHANGYELAHASPHDSARDKGKGRALDSSDDPLDSDDEVDALLAAHPEPLGSGDDQHEHGDGSTEQARPSSRRSSAAADHPPPRGARSDWRTRIFGGMSAQQRKVFRREMLREVRRVLHVRSREPCRA